MEKHSNNHIKRLFPWHIETSVTLNGNNIITFVAHKSYFMFFLTLLQILCSRLASAYVGIITNLQCTRLKMVRNDYFLPAWNQSRGIFIHLFFCAFISIFKCSYSNWLNFILYIFFIIIFIVREHRCRRREGWKNLSPSLRFLKLKKKLQTFFCCFRPRLSAAVGSGA